MEKPTRPWIIVSLKGTMGTMGWDPQINSGWTSKFTLVQNELFWQNNNLNFPRNTQEGPGTLKTGGDLGGHGRGGFSLGAHSLVGVTLG